MAINLEELLRLEIPQQQCSYTERDTMLYALGTGFGSDPMDAAELPFVYEDSLKASPTMGTVLAWDRSWTPRSGIDWPKVVHGDQRLTIHKPLPAAGTVISSARVLEVLDKGKDSGAVVRVETTIREASTGDPLCTATTGFFARGDGGFSGSVMKGPEFHQLPARAPDSVFEAATHPAQALVYRLSGDRNPLHAVPAVAQAAGFPRPVLHGLCTYGIACRAILKTMCDLDPSRIVEFNARFSATLYPGESIRIEMWKDGNVVSFRALCIERGIVVLNNGKAVLRD
ncbi:MAG: 3-alpha,7-alpha, 12-alpha-trihydroxy-5-beta-cholest-24-enoyl-CoA hydratase [Herminiimonas sp.]|jgi:acyl dehydratase|nr:3-alpha,7-alpha, 12-alpha-trihydroxy-5-beta-cholest-24-enoyl-CoA hydratase [Herminiimonas sp.]